MGFLNDLNSFAGYGSISYKDLDESAKRAAALREQYDAERANAGRFVADKVAGQTAQFADPGAAERYDAADPGAATKWAANTVEGPRDVQVGPLNPVERVAAQNVAGAGQAQEAGFEHVQGAELGSSVDRARAAQERLAGMLERTATGQGPSVAEEAYKSKIQDIHQGVMSQAAGARGADKALAKLKAMQTIADQDRRAAFESGQLRAQEALGAQGQLGGVLSSTRGQDVDVATTAAQLKQQAALANQGTGADVSKFNAGAGNQRSEFNVGVAERNAGRDLTAQQTNAGAVNDRTMGEAQLRAGVDAGNVSRTQGAREFNAGAQNTAAASNAGAENTRQQFRGQLLTGVNADNTAAGNKRAEFVATGRTGVADANAEREQRAQTSNQGANLQAGQLNVNEKEGLANAALNANQQTISAKQAQANIEKTNNETKQARTKGLVETGTNVVKGVASLFSDARVKEDVKPVSTDAAARLAKALDVVGFNYKGKLDDGREHFGVIAQQLEKDPLGRQLVSEDGNGIKKVDYQGLTALLLAAALRGRKEARS